MKANKILSKEQLKVLKKYGHDIKTLLEPKKDFNFKNPGNITSIILIPTTEMSEHDYPYMQLIGIDIDYKKNGKYYYMNKHDNIYIFQISGVIEYIGEGIFQFNKRMTQDWLIGKTIGSCGHEEGITISLLDGTKKYLHVD